MSGFIPETTHGEALRRAHGKQTEEWKKVHKIALGLGFDTAMDLVSQLMRNPDWMPTDISDLTTEEMQSFLNMREEIQTWNPIFSEIGGLGILVTSGGWSDIFIKLAIGEGEKIEATDLITAAIETLGAVGLGNALNLLKKVPVIGTKFGGLIDDLSKAAAAFGSRFKEGIKSFDDVQKLFDMAISYGSEHGIPLKEALQTVSGGSEDLLRQAAKIAGEAGDTKLAKNFTIAADDILSQAGKAAGEAAEQVGKEAFEAGTKEVFESLPTSSIDDAVAALEKAGYKKHFLKRFKSIATAKEKTLSTKSAIQQAFKQATDEAPSAGITPQGLKNFKFSHPTMAKLTKVLAGTIGVGGGYVGLKGLEEAAFGGFMFEEAEQMTMFAQFFTSDDLQALARTIAYTSLPVWDMAETWAGSVGRPVESLTSTVLGEGVGSSIFAGPALATHESFTRALIDKLTVLQEKGAWTGLQADPVTGTITEWGRPTTQEEIGSFLEANPQYFQDYEKEIKRLAKEDPGLLYQLYYEGMADWYTDLPGWMREQITQYQEDLKNWKYQAQRGQLSGQDALSMAKAIEGTIWFDQDDPAILSDGIQAGNLVYTMMKEGKISEAKATTFLLGLEATLKNNNHIEDILPLDLSGRIQWSTLTPAQMAESFGSVDLIAEQPQLILKPPGTVLTASVMTPYTSGTITQPPEIVRRDRETFIGATGIPLATEVLQAIPPELKPAIFAKVERRGVGFAGTGPTEEEKAAMAKVPTKVGQPIEGLTVSETRWINGIMEGTTDWDALQRLNPEVYDSLTQKGYTPETVKAETLTEDLSTLLQLLSGNQEPTDLVSLLFPQIPRNQQGTMTYTASKQAEINRKRELREKYQPRGGFTGDHTKIGNLGDNQLNDFFKALEGDEQALEDLGLVLLQPSDPNYAPVWGRKGKSRTGGVRGQ